MVSRIVLQEATFYFLALSTFQSFYFFTLEVLFCFFVFLYLSKEVVSVLCPQQFSTQASVLLPQERKSILLPTLFRLTINACNYTGFTLF